MSTDVSASYSIAGGEAGRERLRRLSAVFAPTTGRLLDRVGIKPNARCLDAGCGGGDVTRMLAARASAGRVIGVDRDGIKVTLGSVAAPSNMELRVEDLADTVRSDERYDVVYTRFILSHLPDPAWWVAALAGLLAPGGVLICEDVRIDGSFCSPSSWAFQRMLAIYCETVRANGADPNVGADVPLFLADTGLTGVGVEVIQRAGMSGDVKHLQHLTLALIRESAAAHGVATVEEVDRLVLETAAFADRVDTVVSTPQIVQSWVARDDAAVRRRPGRPAGRHRPRHLISAIAGTCIALAACSGDDSAEPSTTSAAAEPSTATAAVPSTTHVPTTTSTPPATAEAPNTTAAEPDVTRYAEAGPYPVGVTTLTLPEGTPVEVWYPAAPPVSGTTGYDIRDYVPPAVRALLTADVPAGLAFDGQRDAAIGDGRFPLVVFSHGFSGVRVQSSFLTSHLASWGLVVAAPEHASRDLTNVLAGTASGDRSAAVDEVARTIDVMTTDARFAGHVDAERIGLVGHSAGGFTVLGAALDDRVDGYVSMASGGPGEGAAFPTVPGLLMAGAIDGVVPLEEVTRPAFNASPPGTWLVVVGATGHNGFDDFCTFGDGRGIIGVAEASCLGPLLDAQPQLRALGVDGCEPPAAPVDQAFPIIRHTTTAFLRHLFGDDAAPAIGPGLDDDAALGVTTELRTR